MQRNIFTAAEHPQGSSHSIVHVHMARGAASANHSERGLHGPSKVQNRQDYGNSRGPEATGRQYHCMYRPARTSSILPQLMIDEVTLDVGLDSKFFVVGASCSVWCTSVAGQK